MVISTLLKLITPSGRPAPGAPAQNGGPGDLGSTLLQAFQSQDTPPFGDYVGKLFGQSDPGQRAGVLNQLLQALGPAALSGLAGGALGKLLLPGQTHFTPEQAAQISPETAAAIASEAEAQKPDVLRQVADFYAQNATLINTLGTAALALVATRMKSGPDK